MTAAVDLAAAVHGALDVPDRDLSHRAVVVRDAVEGVVTDADAQAAADLINGGGSPMTALSPEVRELLTVIRDMLDLPWPSDVDPDNRDKRTALMEVRRTLVVGTLNGLVNRDADRNILATAAQALREDLDQCPVGYATKDGEADR